MRLQLTLTKIANNLGYLTLPFLFLSFLVLIFGIYGFSIFEEQDPVGVKNLGGADIWYLMFNVYAIMILLLFAKILIHSCIPEEKKDE